MHAPQVAVHVSYMYNPCVMYTELCDDSIKEMLRKAKQHNSNTKLAALGGIQPVTSHFLATGIYSSPANHT